jgi:tetratricopeptide (TPR) repeat protein
MIGVRSEDGTTRRGGVPVLTPARTRWASTRASRRLHLARCSQAIGELDEAAVHAYRAMRTLHRGVPAGLAASVAYTLAQIECGRARYASSRAHFERAAELLDALPPGGDRDRRRADVHIGLADLHRRGGRYPEATRALTAARRLVPGPDPAIVMLLGVLAKEQGRFGEAARHFATLARIRLSRAEAATLQHNLAVLANAEYRFADAERHARQAIHWRRADPVATAVDTAQDVAVLAAAAAGRHRYDEARQLFGQAIAACRDARPARHYELAVHLHSLAGNEHDCGNLVAAEPLYLEALAIKHRLLGPAHPEVALIMTNLAILLRDLERTGEAANCFQRALGIVEHTFVAHRPLAVASAG